jgi:hypothetical protein
MQGTITRNRETFAVQASFSQGALEGRIIKGTQSFPITLSNEGKKVYVKSGTWKVTLFRYKETL